MSAWLCANSCLKNSLYVWYSPWLVRLNNKFIICLEKIHLGTSSAPLVLLKGVVVLESIPVSPLFPRFYLDPLSIMRFCGNQYQIIISSESSVRSRFHWLKFPSFENRYWFVKRGWKVSPCFLTVLVDQCHYSVRRNFPRFTWNRRSRQVHSK